VPAEKKSRVHHGQIDQIIAFPALRQSYDESERQGCSQASSQAGVGAGSASPRQVGRAKTEAFGQAGVETKPGGAGFASP
jgi:hypothetical protein